MEDEKNLKEKVDDITTTTFHIAGISMKDFKRFIDFCDRNARITKIFYDRVTKQRQIKEELCYAIGISRLLDIVDGNATIQMLYDRIVALEMRLASPQVEAKKEIKTMGRGEQSE